jgi:hypothetical protein
MDDTERIRRTWCLPISAASDAEFRRKIWMTYSSVEAQRLAELARRDLAFAFGNPAPAPLTPKRRPADPG